jgi:uncharacterized protein (TIGR02284 family)
MTRDSDNATVTILNDLIETCHDGEAGFRTCAQNARTPQLKSLFQRRAGECEMATGQLEQWVIRLGGEPERGTSAGADLHRRWMDLRSWISGKDDDAVLSECERGEDVAQQHYEDALKQALPQEIREVVEQQYAGVIRNQDQIRMLRERMGA